MIRETIRGQETRRAMQGEIHQHSYKPQLGPRAPTAETAPLGTMATAAAAFVAPGLPWMLPRRHTRSEKVRRRPRVPSPVRCAIDQAADNAGADMVQVVEECGGGLGMFRGRRLYIADLEQGECDVLEDKAGFADITGVQVAAGDEGVFMRLLRAFFLPAAWPQSVSPDYASFAAWNVGRHLFRSAYYVLGTSSLLYSLGLGVKETLTLSATLNWVLKDGLGMGLKVAISSRLASIVDNDPKQWRFIGDFLMAVSAGIEILSTLSPPYFLVFGTSAALLRQAADAMSGPSYRVFLDSFSISSNIGDVSSRGESQVVIGNLVGLGIGVGASSVLSNIAESNRLGPTMLLYAALASSHLLCTYRELAALQLRTLNRQRLNLILDQFLVDQTVPSVADVNKDEHFLYVPGIKPASMERIRLGAQLLDFVECGRDVSRALTRRSDRFMVAYNLGTVGVMLREDVESVDVLRAMLQARRMLERVDAHAGGIEDWNRERLGALVAETYGWAEEHFELLQKGLKQQGWAVSKLLVGTGQSRYREGRASDLHV